MYAALQAQMYLSLYLNKIIKKTTLSTTTR